MGQPRPRRSGRNQPRASTPPPSPSAKSARGPRQNGSKPKGNSRPAKNRPNDARPSGNRPPADRRNPDRPAPSRPAANRAPGDPPAANLHWREALGPLLDSQNYQPVDERGLLRRLNVPQAEETSFSEFLKAEEALGHIQRDQRGYQSVRRLGLCAGHLQMNERGFGFLVPVDPTESDFYIGGEDTANALHGDLVMARLIVRPGRRDGRLRGEVVRVLKRKRRQLVGTLHRNADFFFVQPDEPRIPYDVRIPVP